MLVLNLSFIIIELKSKRYRKFWEELEARIFFSRAPNCKKKATEAASQWKHREVM
jgi:hypothetical protein